MKVLHNEMLGRFSKGQIVGARLAGTSVNKPGNLLGASRASVSKCYDLIHISLEDITS